MMRRRLRRMLTAALVGVGVSCGESTDGPATVVRAPEELTVTAVGSTSLRLTWLRPEGDVAAFRIDRRTNLEGAFTPYVASVPATTSRLTYFDNATQPDTYYGYRIVALNALGGESPPSNVGGAKTPPPPTLIVRVRTDAPNEASLDPDGYSLLVMGPRDTLAVPLPNNGERRFANIRAGQYSVFLRGLARNCGFPVGDSIRTATVVDAGLQTEATLTYEVTCRDPQRGSIVVRYEQTGDTTDANGVRLDVAGLLTEPDPVDTARVYFRSQRITTRNEQLRFDNLRRGAFDVTLSDVNAPCVLEGSGRRALQVRALSLDTLRYVVSCNKSVVEDTAGKPFVLEHRWSASSAPNGSRVSLTTTLDLSANPATQSAGLQGSFLYAATVLRFDSARTVDFELVTANGRTPGLVNFATTNLDGTARSGRITAARFWFTVIGATGNSTRTATQITTVLSSTLGELKGQVRVREGTLTVGLPVQTTNSAPVARANGPYTGVAGRPIRFSATGSADIDGTIASYNWTFGDGTSSNLDSPDKTYATAGNYTATLTVTDDRGGTGTATAAVTVTPATGGGSNQAPVARITAPVSAALNASVSLSGSNSSDTDGTITAYAWNFGDGTTASGQTVAKSFATPGTYTVTLTVTDDKGATGIAQHTIAVGGGGGTGNAIIWSSAFGSIDPVSKEVVLTVALDLTTDLPDTPGPEALGSFIVDSLKWDPVVLQMTAFNFGPGQSQGIDQSDVNRGKLRFNGSTIASQNSGVLTIARIRFRVLGATGARVSTQTAVGPLVGTPSTGSFNYRAKTEVREATLIVP